MVKRIGSVKRIVWRFSLAAAVACVSFVASAQTYRVTADANDGGGGLSWASAMTLSNAIAAVTADGDGTILIQAGAYPVSAPFDITSPMTIRGGYAGTDDTTLAADPYTTFDGSNKVERIFNVTTGTSENDYNRFSRCIFKRCAQQNFKKSGLGSLEAEDCAFLESVDTKGSGKADGWGGCFTGTAGKSKLALRRCLFAGNRTTYNAYSEGNVKGMGAYIGNFASAALVDCQFVTNGIALGVGYGSRPYSRQWGAALYVTSAPLAMTNTTFKLNRGLEFGDWGSVIYIAGSSGGSVFDHCLFIANESVGQDTSKLGGALEIASGNTAHAYLFNHCTFAWNLSARSASTPAGLFVATGTATIRNCIFAGNIASTYASVGTDLHVGSGGKAIVSHTSFGGEGAVYASSSSATGLDFTGGGIRYGDPLFVSSLGSVTNYLAGTGKKTLPISESPVYWSAAKMRDILALDAHLLSSEGYLTNDDTNTWRKAESHSPCIDSGDPDAPYAEEPTPNGNHANLGCYGNTPQASKTASGKPGIDGEVSVTYPFGYSQPRILFTLGGEGVYKAKVTIKVSADGGETWAATRVDDGRMRGETVEWFVPEWFEKGATLKVVVSVDGGSETIEAVVASEVTVDPPPQGGDASKVIHVRPDAKGRGDGTSWFHAMTDLHAAILAAKGATNEIWAAGTYLMTADATGLNPSVDIVIRGGFAGNEASPEERQEGCRTTIDGQLKRTPLNFKNANAVTLERIALTNAVAQSVVKTGGGDMTLRECLVAGNKIKTTGLIGSFTGASGAVLRFEDCDFADDNIGSYLRQVNGGAITAKTFARVEVLNCRFLRVGNGQLGTDSKWTQHGDQVSGSVIYAESAPLTVCGTSFVGCHNENGGGFGGLVVVKGAASKCAFTNCLWCACEDIYSGYLDTEDRAGALVLDLANAGVEADIVNCTFAWNLADARRSPAALNVIKGAAKVRSTIFHNSITSVTTTCGCDIDVKAGSSVDVAWSHFDREGTVTKQDETATVVPGEGLKYGDPGLISEDEPVNSRVKAGGSYGFKNTIRSLVAGLNAHLRGGSGYRNEKAPHELVTDFAKRGYSSSALDTGDRSVKCVEPRPNGHRVNMGCYGNTPWATRSKHGGALIVR